MPEIAATKKTPEKPLLKKGERTRLRILEAALQITSEKGFEGFTLLDVADVAGVTRGNVLRLFNTRENLIEEATYFVGQRGRDFRENYFASNPLETSPLDYVRSMFAWLYQHPTYLGFMMALLNRSSYDKISRRSFIALMNAGRQRIFEILMKQQLEKRQITSFNEEELRRLAFEVHSTLVGYLVLTTITDPKELPALEEKCLRTIEGYLKFNNAY